MKQYNYPDYESHKIEHDAFVAKVVEVERKFNRGQLVISTQITDFLKEWLKNHILGTDQKYSDFLVKHNVK